MLGYRYAKLRDAILGFRGRLTIAFGIDLAGLSEISGQDELLERHQWLAIILSPKNATSGATDLEPMVKKLNRTVERRVPRKLNDLTVGGRRFRTCEVNNDSVLRNGTLPFLLDGHAVLVISNKIKKALKTMLTGQSSSLVAVERKLESKMLAIYVDLQAVWRLFFSIPESDYEDNPRVSRSTLKILQVERIHSMLFSVSPLGPFVAMDTDITLASEGGSIFDAFRVPGTLDDSMLDSIPDDLVGAELFRVDPARLWEFGEKFGAHLAEREGADWDSELLRNNWVCG